MQVPIFSSSDFNVEIEYKEKTDQTLLKHKITRSDADSNDYSLSLFVPNEIIDDFSATVKLIHPYTNFQLSLFVTFSYEAEIVQVQQEASRPRQTVRANYQPQNETPDYEGMQRQTQQ